MTQCHHHVHTLEDLGALFVALLAWHWSALGVPAAEHIPLRWTVHFSLGGPRLCAAATFVWTAPSLASSMGGPKWTSILEYPAPKYSNMISSRRGLKDVDTHWTVSLASAKAESARYGGECRSDRRAE